MVLPPNAVARSPRQTLLAYVMAAAACTLVVTIKFTIFPFLEAGFLTLFVAAVAFASWYGGFGPGVFATSTLALAALFFFLEPIAVFGIGGRLDVLRLLLFVAVGIFVSSLSGALRRAVAVAARQKEDTLRALHQVESAESALRASEARLRLMVEGVKEYAIFLVDDEGRVVTWTRGAERLFGYADAQAIGYPVDHFIVGDPTPRSDVTAALDRARATGRVEISGTYRRADGTAFHAEILVAALDPEPGSAAFIVFVHDLTARRVVEAQLAELNAEYREFVTWTSHEISEPARSAETLLAYLENDPRITASPDARELVVRVRRNVGRIKRMLAGLREYSEVTAASTFTRVDAEAALDRVLERLRDTIEDHGARIVRDTPLEPVGGSEGIVEEILAAIIENAIVHNNAAEPEVVVRGSVGPDGDRRIEVLDNGPGIIPDMRDRVFRVFTRGPHTPRDAPAAGIGLTLARRAAHAVGGEVDVLDPPDASTGARIRITLMPPPRQRAGAGGDAHDSPASAGPSTTRGGI